MAKREAKKVVQEGKWQAYNKLYSKLEEGEKIIYKLAKTREMKTRDLNNAHFGGRGITGILRTWRK